MQTKIYKYEVMKIYLAGFKTIERYWNNPTKDIYLLSSFWEHRAGKYGDYVRNKNHILDSGAYSAITGIAKNINWDVYIEKYANFINKNNIELFFELDIDNIVGLKEVERLRAKLEKLTNKKCIPVWHKSRGKEYWLQMVKDYDYVAIGGIVTKEIKRKEYPYFHWLLKEAKKQNCKVHGLGFTNMKGLIKYPFYSVDSTNWLNARFGSSGADFFNGKIIKNIKKPEGKKKKNLMVLSTHNFKEWVKFQKYALKNL